MAGTMVTQSPLSQLTAVVTQIALHMADHPIPASIFIMISLRSMLHFAWEDRQ